MATIKAPFNFVPLADKVVFPKWATQISQDIPFSEEISGSIRIEIEAKTPIFVRNGHKPVSDKNSIEYQVLKNSEEFKSFSKTPDESYFIPASSIKGELRHIIEVLAFCKMKTIDNKRYGIRDLNYKKYRDALPCDAIHCGWMTINSNDGTVSITDNGNPYRISHKAIDQRFNSRFCELFGEGKKIKDENRNAKYKYANCSSEVNNVFQFDEYKICPNNAVDPRVGVYFNPEGKIYGRIVFTGQPGDRKPAKLLDRKNNKTYPIDTDELSKEEKEKMDIIKASGKFYEFVFREVENPHTFTFTMEDDLYKDFEFIYKKSDDWKYWKNSGHAIPVFFMLENGRPSSIGLSFLYKLPFKKRMKEYLNDDHNSTTYDLSECLFGTTYKKGSLKGRVQITHAICIDDMPYEEIKPYLAMPKPTYYPIYLEQGNNGKDGYLDDNKSFTTMMDNNVKLKGWKFYPTRLKETTDFSEVEENQEENKNPAIPLGKGSSFCFAIKFHNLKKEELGAILFALTPQPSSCHTIGFGKPYGFGVCSYKVLETVGFEKEKISDYISSFQNYMSSEIPDYLRTPQIKELLLMMNPNQAERLKSPLKYMDLDDFVKCKQHNPQKKEPKYGEYLLPYSQLLKPIEQKAAGPSVYLAEVTLVKGMKKAKLKDGKSLSMVLDMNNKKDRLRVGDVIEVELIKKGKELRFIRKK